MTNIKYIANKWRRENIYKTREFLVKAENLNRATDIIVDHIKYKKSIEFLRPNADYKYVGDMVIKFKATDEECWNLDIALYKMLGNIETTVMGTTKYEK